MSITTKKEKIRCWKNGSLTFAFVLVLIITKRFPGGEDIRIRTKYDPTSPEWEMSDLVMDKAVMNHVYIDPGIIHIIKFRIY